jgi:hypothetical protein
MNAAGDGYVGYFDDNANAYIIGRSDDGIITALGSSVAGSLTNGTTLRLEARGSDFILINGSTLLLSRQDTTYTTGYGGLYSSAAAYEHDDFEVGNVTGIAFKGATDSGTTGAPGRTGNGTISVTLPTWAAGDFVIIVLYSDQGSGAITTPSSGWTQVTGSPWGSGTEKLQAFYRIMQTGDGNPTITISDSGTNMSHVAAAAVYTGVDATPIGVVGTASAGTGTPMTAGEINVATANSFVLGLCGRGDNESSSGQTFGASTTGVTERFDSGTSEGSDSQVSLYDKLAVSTGNCGNGSATTSATDPWVSVLIALKPDSGNASKSVTDTGSGSDSVSRLVVAVGLADSGSGADGPPGVIARLGLTDSASGVDAAPSIQVSIPISDNGAGVDLISAILSALALSDSASAGDEVAASVSTSVSDSGAGIDSTPSIVVSLSLTDSGSGADAVSVLQQLLLSISDSGSGSDALAGIVVTLALSDTGAGADAQTLAAALAISDTGVGADLISVLTETLKQIADSGAGLDSVSAISATLTLADAASGADAPGVTVSLSLADTASAADAVSLAERIAQISDTGSGADTVAAVSASLTLSDAAAAVDLIAQVKAALAVSDTGSGVDVAVVVTFLAHGRVSVTFTAKRPSVGFTGKKPGVIFSAKKPTVTFH